MVVTCRTKQKPTDHHMNVSILWCLVPLLASALVADLLSTLPKVIPIHQQHKAYVLCREASRCRSMGALEHLRGVSTCSRCAVYLVEQHYCG